MPTRTTTTSTSVSTTAAVFHGPEAGLVLETVRLTEPLPSEVRLRVVACGACHSDVHKLHGQGLVPAPNVFGHEISGVITAVGSAVEHLQSGDRVVCSFLVPCGECAACRSGAEDECEPFRATMQRQGVRFDGSFRMATESGEPLRTSGIGGLAGEITMPATAVFALPADWPEEISLQDSAVLGCAGLTAYGAVHEAGRVAPGDAVVVLGGGGVGLCVAALARHAGASVVIGTDMKPEARDALERFGADSAFPADHPRLEQRIAQALEGRRAAVVFDTIGLAATLRQALRIVGVGGTVVVSGLGGTSGPAAIDDLTVFVRRKLSLVGSYAAVPSRDMPKLLGAVADGALNPADLISVRYPFERVADAYADVAAGEVTGRALIIIGSDDPITSERTSL